MILRRLFDLAPLGADTFVGTGPQYPWGGLFGGHIVAQALCAAASTVDPDLPPHSLRAYFIRRGDHTEPVGYEVDRIRDGRSFATRRVVSRQAVGAILNLEASFQRAEPSFDLTAIRSPDGVPGPADLADDSWTTAFDRRLVPAADTPPPAIGAGRVMCWFRATEDVGDDPLLHGCSLAYISDDMPADAVHRARFADDSESSKRNRFTASLDHTVWFHRPARADRWQLHDFSCHTFVGGRGLAIGHVFAENGDLLATVAQEVLVREIEQRA